MVKVSDIKINKANPRQIKDDRFKKLIKSIREFQKMLELRPIVIDDDGTILGGNMRFRALLELGYNELPDSWVRKASELTDEEKQRFIIEDNVPFGEWDWEKLANEWDDKLLEEWGLELPTISNEVEANEDDYEIPDEIKTDIVLGDLFEFQKDGKTLHKLICGDGTQKEVYEKLMQGELADMVITDPPYNVSYQGKTKDKLVICNDSLSNNEFYRFLYDFYSAIRTVVKKGGAIYVWHASSEIINFAKAMVDAGWLLKQQLIWEKNAAIMGRQDYHWKHEPCLYGWLDGGRHNWYADRKQTTIIKYDKPQRNGEHPTMKPVGLFAYLINNSSKIGDIVIDAFGGSGTTMVACEQLKRKSRIIELDPKYCQVIIDRMMKLDNGFQILKNGNPL